jgi:hypothetical protein
VGGRGLGGERGGARGQREQRAGGAVHGGAPVGGPRRGGAVGRGGASRRADRAPADDGRNVVAAGGVRMSGSY